MTAKQEEMLEDLETGINVQIARNGRIWHGAPQMDFPSVTIIRKEGLEVEDCENWLEISMVSGGHCFNCVNRDGYPWRSRPGNPCTRFVLKEKT